MSCARLSEHAATLAERLDARKVIDRAKGLLMDRDGMTEQAAFTYVQQAAMQSRQTMKAVAQGILDGDGARAPVDRQR